MKIYLEMTVAVEVMVTKVVMIVVMVFLDDHWVGLLDVYGYLDWIRHGFVHFDGNLDGYLDLVGYFDWNLMKQLKFFKN